MTKNNDFVTKTYLDKKLSSFKTELKDELKSELYEIKDEFDTHQYSHVRINEEIEEHDKRITVLETATS
jgi:hypothetical protein